MFYILKTQCQRQKTTSFIFLRKIKSFCHSVNKKMFYRTVNINKKKQIIKLIVYTENENKLHFYTFMLLKMLIVSPLHSLSVIIIIIIIVLFIKIVEQ